MSAMSTGTTPEIPGIDSDPKNRDEFMAWCKSYCYTLTRNAHNPQEWAFPCTKAAWRAWNFVKLRVNAPAPSTQGPLVSTVEELRAASAQVPPGTAVRIAPALREEIERQMKEVLGFDPDLFHDQLVEIRRRETRG